MKKAYKLIFVFLCIIIVLGLAGYNQVYKKYVKTANNIATLSDKTIVDWGIELSGSEITENTYKVLAELTQKRDRNIVEQLCKERNINSLTFEGSYLSSLLLEEKNDDFKFEYENIVVNSSAKECKDLYSFLFSSINAMSKKKDDILLKIYNTLCTYDWLVPPNRENKMNFYSFMYFLGLSSNANDIDVREFHILFEQAVKDIGLDYIKQFEIDRLLYNSLILNTNCFDRFETMFLITYGDNEDFKGTDLSYIISSHDFNTEQKEELCKVLLKLKLQTDKINEEKLSQIDHLIQILKKKDE